MNMSEIFAKYIRSRNPEFIKGDYGIEIETETTDPYDLPPLINWSCTNDGSLRGFGVEYLSNGALDMEQIPIALREFHTKTKKIPFNDSVYSSLHVHVNMYHMSVKQFPVYMSLLYLMENVLVRYCGPDRDGNLFCLKTSQAEGGLEGLIQIFNAFDQHDMRAMYRQLGKGRAAKQKYSAINYASLANLGTVELRMHGGTTDITEIERWINIIHQIKINVGKYNTPNDVISRLNELGAVNMVHDTFGEFSKHLVTNQTVDDVNDSLFYLIRIAKAANWDEFDPKMIKQKKSDIPKDVDDVIDEILDDEVRPSGLRVSGGTGIQYFTDTTAASPQLRGRRSEYVNLYRQARETIDDTSN